MQTNLWFEEQLAEQHRRELQLRAEKQQQAQALLNNESQRPPRRSRLAKYRAAMPSSN